LNIFLISLCYFLYSAASQVTVLPVTLARGEYYTVNVNQVNYFKVTPCDDSVVYNTAVLSVSLPTNPTWQINMPFVVVELSTCENTFNSNCVFATNYIWESTPKVYAQIVWDWTKYLNQYGSFYIRVTARTKMVAYAFQIQFVENQAITAGVYSSSAFPQSSAPSGTIYNQLIQYVHIPKPDTVKNYQTKTYFVKLCIKDLPTTCDVNSISIIATATASFAKPMTLLSLYGCGKNTGPGCGLFQSDVKDETSSSVAQVEMSVALQPDIVDGMYFTVYGIGGEIDATNQYYIDLKMYS